MADKYVFLDRDGVINEDAAGVADSGYVVKWEDFHFIPGVLSALRLFNGEGYKVIIISNQQCVGKGFVSLDGLGVLSAKIRETARESGGDIAAFYYCPHLEEDDCECRKPREGLFHKAAVDFNISDFTGKYYVGDNLTDVQAGRKAGVKTVLVLSGKTSMNDVDSWDLKPDLICKDLLDAAKSIIRKDKNDY